MSSIGGQNNSLEEEIGNCPEHDRPFECYSIDANKLICPSCLMFGNHKGDKVCRIEDAAKDVRMQIDDAGKQGLLRAERCENILLDIRDTKLTCEEKKQNILQEVEAVFSQVIRALKQRKEDVITEIKDHFDTEFESIYNQEQKWVGKQEACQELVNFARNEQDAPILLNAKQILDNIEQLKEQQQYQRIQLINSLDTLLKTQSGSTTLKEFLGSIKEFVQKGEIINQQYKC